MGFRVIGRHIISSTVEGIITDDQAAPTVAWMRGCVEAEPEGSIATSIHGRLCEGGLWEVVWSRERPT